MSHLKLSLFILLGIIFTGCSGQDLPELKEGDILFQSLETKQSKAIELATHSRYTHVGMLVRKGKNLYVYEAVGPVRYTDVNEWIAAGVGDRYTVRRLKDSSALIGQGIADRLRKVSALYLGKPYDFIFNWSDQEIYCSELVWKIYHEALGIDLNTPQPLGSFDLSSAEVQSIMRSRYGNKIPLKEPMISPQQLFESEYLYTVYEQ